MFAADAVPTEKDSVAASRAVKLAEKLRCLVCQNQTIADSNAELAQDLRRQVHEQIAAGKSDDEIVDYMVARYGDFVLYQPPVKATTVLLWAGPALLLLAACRRPRPHTARAPRPGRVAPAHRPGTRARSATPGRRQRERPLVITFVLIAAVMVAAALACVLVPLLKRRRPGGVAREASNVALLRDQLRELDADLATGTMPRDQYDQAKRELEQRVLEESQAIAQGTSAPTQSAAWTAAILGSAIPLAALLLYVTLGNHDAFTPTAARSAKAGADHEVTPQQVEAMATNLAARLEKEPGNVDGWVMLARTYYAMNRHADAARAFDRAVALLPDNADLLADYADSVGAAEGGLRGKSLELIERALKADPTHWKALALAGTAAFERKDYRQAVDYWERMKKTVPPDSPIAGSIDASIAEARELGGLKAGAASGSTALAAAPGPVRQRARLLRFRRRLHHRRPRRA